MKKLLLCLTLLALGISDFVLLPPRSHHGHEARAADTEQAAQPPEAGSSGVSASGSASADSSEPAAATGTKAARTVQTTEPSAAPEQNNPAGLPSEQPSPLDEHIRGWIAMLAEHPSFAEWREATYETYPLGPGTHSWVVLLSKNGSEVGYLIVTADKDGKLSLSEYGTGDKPLFSMQTLYQSMMQREIIANYTLSQFAEEPLLRKERYYAGPLESFWKVTLRHDTFYFDAKTGERMPVLEAIADQENAEAADYGGLSAKHAVIEEQTMIPAFDPNDKPAWISGDALSLSTIDDLKRELAQEPKLTFSAKLLGGNAIYPLAVTGYAVFSGGVAYLAVDHDGDRFLPFRHIAAQGQFFR